MAIEIVDLPIKNGDFPSFFLGLPEGSWWFGSRKLEVKLLPAEALGIGTLSVGDLQSLAGLSMWKTSPPLAGPVLINSS